MNKAPTISTGDKQGQGGIYENEYSPPYDDLQEEFEEQEITSTFSDMQEISQPVKNEENKIIPQSDKEEREVLKKYNEEQKKPKPLKVYSIREVIQKELEPKEYLVFPIIAFKALIMVFASRGIGKTFFALYLAYAIASGSDFLKWKVPKPRKILYVDGEMPAQAIRERLLHIINFFPNEAQDGYFNIINSDLQDEDVIMPNIATAEGQERIEQHLVGIELIVIDNLATLARNGRANDEESFSPVQEWILKLRRRGIAVLLVHHASKNGSQRGTSAREDVLDTVIQLSRPKDYESEQGARFEVHYTKSRGFYGEEAEPFEAQLVTKENSTEWQTKKLEDVTLEKIRLLASEDMSQRDIATELQIDKSKVNRLCKKHNITTKGGSR